MKESKQTFCLYLKRLWIFCVVLAALVATGFSSSMFVSKSYASSTVTMIKDIDPAITDGEPNGSYPESFVPMNDEVYFSVEINDQTGQHYSLWKTDGTAAGTQLVKDTGIDRPHALASNGDILYFNAGDNLWKSDGTTAGTVIVQPNLAAEDITAFGNEVYFDVDTNFGGGEGGLWKSDGTPEGTVQISSNPVQPSSLIAEGNYLYFNTRETSDHPYEFWRTDGTPTGLIKISNTGAGQSVGHNGIVYFITGNSVLMRTDGTPSGTYAVKENLLVPSELVIFNSLLYFRGELSDLPNAQSGLWKSDGTETGTIFIKDIGALPGQSSDIYDFNVADDNMYFVGNDGVNGHELWNTDGTTEGTYMVKDIADEINGAGMSIIGTVGSRAYFVTYRPEGGDQLWQSDGTEETTVLVSAVSPRYILTDIQNWLQMDDAIIFAASDQIHGNEPWIITNTESVIFNSSADTHVRSGQGNRNYGAVDFMRVQPSGDNRAIVRFDQSELLSTIGSGSGIISAKLRLTITDNGNNWGTAGRTVDVHRLIADWLEGDGTENDRGSGNGTTWNCAIDSLIENQAKNCSGTTEWEMGQPNNPSVHPWVETATDSQTITNNQTGVVEYDVTADVAEFLAGTETNYGWIIKKTNEGQNGMVSFGTRESISIPQLEVTYLP